MPPRAGAPFITPGDVLACRVRHGMSDAAIECLAFGRMCLALPDGVRQLINQKIHGDPAFPNTYLVRFDPLQSPIDLVNNSAYPEELRGDLPPGYNVKNFWPVGSDAFDLDYATDPKQAKLRAFFNGDFVYYKVWIWIEDEEEDKDSRWELVRIEDVDWRKYDVEDDDEAFEHIDRIADMEL